MRAERGDTTSVPVTAANLALEGWIPLEIRPVGDVAIPDGGIGLVWDLDGEVRSEPGLYLFTVSDPREAILTPTYVGQTRQLCMVTHGRAADGAARGGQHYGRPKYAGQTRKRVNLLVRERIVAGMAATHWVKPMAGADKAELMAAEERAIRGWALREVGWNIR